jgi:hypothetical protein
MESFCTLLQYRVNLSMFHSLSTSKIWQMSTYNDVRYDGAKSQICIVEIFCTTGSLLSLPSIMEKLFFELQML